MPLLDEGYYRLQEIKAPAGYNLPTTAFDFYIHHPGDATGQNKSWDIDPIHTDTSVYQLEGTNQALKVINHTGQKLPDTGGEGTNLYTSGGILLIAAGCLLYMFSKKQSYGKGEQ